MKKKNRWTLILMKRIIGLLDMITISWKIVLMIVMF